MSESKQVWYKNAWLPVLYLIEHISYLKEDIFLTIDSVLHPGVMPHDVRDGVIVANVGH